MTLASKDCTVALAFPLLLLPPLPLCRNVGDNDNTNDDSGGGRGSGGSNKDNSSNSGGVSGCAPLVFVRLTHRGAPKIWLTMTKWGLPERYFQEKPTVGFNEILMNLDYLW